MNPSESGDFSGRCSSTWTNEGLWSTGGSAHLPRLCGTGHAPPGRDFRPSTTARHLHHHAPPTHTLSFPAARPVLPRPPRPFFGRGGSGGPFQRSFPAIAERPRFITVSSRAVRRTWATGQNGSGRPAYPYVEPLDLPFVPMGEGCCRLFVQAETQGIRCFGELGAYW